jgi:hypothetical protein
MPEHQSMELVANAEIERTALKHGAIRACTAHLFQFCMSCSAVALGLPLNRVLEDLMDKDKPSLDDPLGIAGAPVPKDANDIHATNDPDEVARRRARARGDNDPEVRGPGDDVNDDSFGASIDMGYGGEGNAISRNRR